MSRKRRTMPGNSTPVEKAAEDTLERAGNRRERRGDPKEAPVRHRVLGIGTGGGIFDDLDPLLAELNSELYLAPSARVGLEMVRSLGAVDLIIVEHPLSGTSARAFLTDLRQVSRGTLRVAVLVGTAALDSLDDPDDPDCIILSLEHSPEELSGILGALLEHAPRMAIQLMVRLELEADKQRVLRLAQTENISKTGMLLRTSDDIPEEAVVGFEFYIPEDSHPISGEASVVRKASDSEEEFEGVALHFDHLLGSDQLRLEQFLATSGGRR